MPLTPRAVRRAQPQDRRFAGPAQGEQRGEGGGTGRIERVGGEDFMRSPHRQPAAERGIESRMPARQPRAVAGRRAGGGDPGDAAAQPGERGGRIAHDMFSICSISA